MATKGKESTLVKKGGMTPSNSLSTQDKSDVTTKKTRQACVDRKDSMTASKKPIPNYLKPTLSSHNERAKPIKKNYPDDSTQKSNLMRGRSFDRSPSVSGVQNAHILQGLPERSTSRSSSLEPQKRIKKNYPDDSSQKPNLMRRSFDRSRSVSRVENPHISAGPRERSTTRSSSFTGKINIPKPILDKTSRTSTMGAKMQQVLAKSVKSISVPSKKESTGSFRKKVSSSPNTDSTKKPPAVEIEIEEKKSDIKVVEEVGDLIKSDSEDLADSVINDIEVDTVSDNPFTKEVADEEGAEEATKAEIYSISEYPITNKVAAEEGAEVDTVSKSLFTNEIANEEGAEGETKAEVDTVWENPITNKDANEEGAEVDTVSRSPSTNKVANEEGAEGETKAEVDAVSENQVTNELGNEEGTEEETKAINNANKVEGEEDKSKLVSSDIQLEEDSRGDADVQETADKTEDVTEIPENGNETVISSIETVKASKAEGNAEDEEKVARQETQQANVAVEEKKPEAQQVNVAVVEKKPEARQANVVAEEKKPQAPNSLPKRQVGQGKKDSPAYNDIIEETTSKLMEKRKNKVRALVGAFETVIDYESAK